MWHFSTASSPSWTVILVGVFRKYGVASRFTVKLEPEKYENGKYVMEFFIHFFFLFIFFFFV